MEPYAGTKTYSIINIVMRKSISRTSKLSFQKTTSILIMKRMAINGQKKAINMHIRPARRSSVVCSGRVSKNPSKKPSNGTMNEMAYRMK